MRIFVWTTAEISGPYSTYEDVDATVDEGTGALYITRPAEEGATEVAIVSIFHPDAWQRIDYED